MKFNKKATPNKLTKTLMIIITMLIIAVILIVVGTKIFNNMLP